MSEEQATPEVTPAAVPDAPPPPPEVAEVTPPPVPEPALLTPEVKTEAPPAAAETPAELPAEANGESPESSEPATPPSKKRWYVVKVQSGREDTIKDAVERRVRIEGLEEFYGQIVIPTEKVVEMRNNKRVTRSRKLFPGYLMVEVEYNDRILYLFRETSGVGDFVGAAAGGGVTQVPTPMSEREVERMIRKPGEKAATVIPVKPKFSLGDRVKINQGVFSGMEGEVKELLEAKSQVRVEVAIFGRPVSVELEYWQVDPV